MEHKLNTLKNDLHNVFVDGNANSLQMARVFMLLAVPLLTICMMAVRHIVY
ncbi:hypothetical protein KXD93_28790 [Mucilaginibacter sp. BJC16-A38]|uniref:hypothetical protein n=1 Tax=Mucilaginibacter phenanthrenivorans TaxID=1234842 RepID=UPI0021573BB8|nr:hypothetical protein [Mucilaginibacter phenanthrenivorans]MCR8561687.1 hypothetical protein [Mucilaginibacter phenanthrenivorans]